MGTHPIFESDFDCLTEEYFCTMDMMDQIIDPAKEYLKNAVRFIRRSTKPDKKEFQKIAFATAIGFLIMGFIGYFVKLIHIPINNIIRITLLCLTPCNKKIDKIKSHVHLT